MSYRDSQNEIVLRAADLFITTGEAVYPLLIDYPKPFPVRYQAYDLGSAAIEVMMEEEPSIIRKDINEVIRERQQIEAELQEITPDWEDILMARMIAATILNSYGGPDRPFSPN